MSTGNSSTSGIIRSTSCGGTVDYFAILGVGDNLIWKHEQKESFQTRLSADDDDRLNKNCNENGSERIEGNDEHVQQHQMKAHIEQETRFLREIVVVSIEALTTASENRLREPTFTENKERGFNSDLIKESDEKIANSINHISQTPSFRSEDSSANLNPSVTSSRGNAGSEINQYQDTGPQPSFQEAMHDFHLSPCQSDATSIPNCYQRNKSNVGAPSKSVSIENGRNRVKSTLPAAVEGYGFSVSNVNETQNEDGEDDNINKCPELWKKNESFDANLDFSSGLRVDIISRQIRFEQNARREQTMSTKSIAKEKVLVHGLRRKMQSTFQTFQNQLRPSNVKVIEEIENEAAAAGKDYSQKYLRNNPFGHKSFYLEFQRRNEISINDRKCIRDLPSIADVKLCYVRLHWESIPSIFKPSLPEEISVSFMMVDSDPSRSNANRASVVSRGGFSVLDNEKTHVEQSIRNDHMQADQCRHTDTESNEFSGNGRIIPLEDCLNLPDGFDSWVIPDDYRWIRDPRTTKVNIVRKSPGKKSQNFVGSTLILDQANTASSNILEEGVETIRAMSPTHPDAEAPQPDIITIGEEELLPRLWTPGKDDPSVLVSNQSVAFENGLHEEYFDLNSRRDAYNQYFCIPILAIRRQRVSQEELYHEDPAVVELAVSFCSRKGEPSWPDDRTQMEEFDSEFDETDETFRVLGKTPWLSSIQNSDISQRYKTVETRSRRRRLLGIPVLLVRKNLPFGLADVAFATTVLGRFPFQNYKGLPLPMEELPMFCYPTGCRLHRARFCDAPLPQYYGFVLKNERGDSIYVSCVSFFEPLTPDKLAQLSKMSQERRETSVPHRLFCQLNDRQINRSNVECSDDFSMSNSTTSAASTEIDSNFLLTGFDDMTTFENKTICLISRYPFWTAFRKFLSHLHLVSVSPTELPIERWISHLLLSVPLPRCGGPSIIIPLAALNEPMVLSFPPEKDFPLVDLPFQRLFSCLEIRTVITLVLGLLVLERKVIILSSRPSLVLDICELARSLLFPFELCAPYVPRLTEPFKTSLDFPGAIFVGIHDDGSSNGLAAMVKASLPEDSVVVDIDTGNIYCDGDRLSVITKAWEIIPDGPRADLASELETLCRDVQIIDGQEPLDSLLDSAFSISLSAPVHGRDGDLGSDIAASITKEQLDDRAVRDAFLRFFCSILGGYERYLVVPDADFLVSGNEWFDAQGFLASMTPEKTPYVQALISTQLFQSFIQRRTEASDVHCLLFDECLAEFHSSPSPYGRLGSDVENTNSTGQPEMLYSLLVDQSATIQAGSDQTIILGNRSMDASEADSSFSFNVSKVSGSYTDITSLKYSESVTNSVGDLITLPSRQGLPLQSVFVYFMDGNPCFPHLLNSSYLLPKEPDSWLLETWKSPLPLLARNDRELDEAHRRRRVATSHRFLHNQRRCLWQLPKLMGSHVLGSWLLCIPAYVSQKHISHDTQTKYLLRGLGALRLLRSKQRIVPDEAAYRALMVACGRTGSDRRIELVKLFGILRSDGIFPSAVTLGQYTRALAEGYSKRSSGAVQDDDVGNIEVTESGSRGIGFGDQKSMEIESCFDAIDPSLSTLEGHGSRWRQKGVDPEEKKNRKSKSWYPVMCSSSFVASCNKDKSTRKEIRLLAIWSRTRSCPNCSYIPLEEELQAGWDVVVREHNVTHTVACPRCKCTMTPSLGYKDFSLDEASKLESTQFKEKSSLARNLDTEFVAPDFETLPPQIGPLLSSVDGCSYVNYVDPASLRQSLEHYVEALGEEVLDRDVLMDLDIEVLINFWWFCARFSLPLPLPVNADGVHYCAFAAWDRSTAERGCCSASKVLSPLVASRRYLDSDVLPSDDTMLSDLLEEAPLLSRFNLQGFYSSVWDHNDLAKMLVVLVEACDKRDFTSVIETIVRCNQRRRKAFKTQSATHEGCRDIVELDAYRTILYLAKYQCTTAFHAFFPSTLKACKGYHFWCATGAPLPMFDRLLRDGIRRYHRKINANDDRCSEAPLQTVSDIALGFRCVFGHLI